MIRFGCVGFIVVFLAGLVEAGERERGKPSASQGDALARKAIEDFVQLGWNLNVEGVVKLVDVPWCYDGREIVKDNDQLREIVKKMVRRSVDPKKVHIRRIATLETFKEEKNAPPARKYSLGDVLGKENRIVYVEFETNEARFQPVWFAIRLQFNQAKIVGAID